ncbi:MAG: M48 family metallopeptidase [Candidatus Sericytochromatia bacterium]
MKLTFLQGYAPHLQAQVANLLEQNALGAYLLDKYPTPHTLRSPQALYDYTLELKQTYLRQSRPLSKVIYDDKLNLLSHALGLHVTRTQAQGSRTKAKHEIRIASLFRHTPPEFLKMIVVHELAHLRESDHNKAFYQLCRYMEPDYHQFEFDLRLYLTHLDQVGELYSPTGVK